MLRNLADDPRALVVALGVLFALLALTATAVLVVAAVLRTAAPDATAVARARMRDQVTGLAARATALGAIVWVLGFTSERWQPLAFLVGAAVNATARLVLTVARRGPGQRGEAVPRRSGRLVALPVVAYGVLALVVAACASTSDEVRPSLPMLVATAAAAAVLTEVATRVVLRRPSIPGLSAVEDLRVRHAVAVRMARIEALAVVVTAVVVLFVTGGTVATVGAVLLVAGLPVWTLAPLGRP